MNCYGCGLDLLIYPYKDNTSHFITLKCPLECFIPIVAMVENKTNPVFELFRQYETYRKSKE